MEYTHTHMYIYICMCVCIYVYTDIRVCRKHVKNITHVKKPIKLYPYRYIYMCINAQKKVCKATLQNDNSNYLQKVCCSIGILVLSVVL